MQHIAVSITGLYAGILGLLFAALTINVIRNRVAHRVEKGDGGVPALQHAIRAHGNFTEQTPMMLILLGLIESAGSRPVVVHVLGIAMLVSRFASGFGLTQTLGISLGRQVGAGVGLVVVVASGSLLLLAFIGIR
jgi:uncharacterized membrane protein YecN with MAPEG domain